MSTLLTVFGSVFVLAITSGGWMGVVIPSVAGVVALGLCYLAILYERGRAPAFVTNFGVLMTYLDRLTDRQKLKELFAQQPVTTGTRTLDPKTITEALKSEIIGNDAVILDVVRQVRGRFAQVKRTGPVGVFMFVGPSSTGKSEFGRALGRVLFGKGGSYTVKMNMFSQPLSNSTLFGSSPGYSGSDSMASFTQHLSTNPATVIILDEFEKADPSVQTGFLSAWNDGELTDMTRGRQISTTQAIFVLTTNACQDQIEQAARTFSGDRRELSQHCKQILRQSFDTAILSRINYVFPMIALEREELADLLTKLAEAHVQSYDMVLHDITPQTLYNYVTQGTQRGLDARAMADQIEHDISDSLIELKEAGLRDVVILELGGQVLVRKYVAPTLKKPRTS